MENVLINKYKTYHDQVIGRMIAEGFSENPVKWSDSDINAGLDRCVLSDFCKRVARELRESRKYKFVE